MTLIKPIKLSKILVYNNLLNLYLCTAMYRFTQPSPLNLDAGSPSASKEWSHWLKTFENYVEILDASRADGQPTDRLKALVNCVSYQVYEYIEESTTYGTAIATLRDLFSKTPNEVFARHLLAAAKQKPGHTLDEFLLSLQKLAKDCNFRAVTGVQYKQEIIRDAFTYGFISTGIRQRLLEHRELNLETAVEKARAMELTQNNGEYYFQSQDTIQSSFSSATLQEKKSETLVVKLVLPYHPLLFTSHQRPHLA